MSTVSFDTVAGFYSAVVHLLERCERRLCLFDRDFEVGPLGGIRAVELLERLLRRSPKAECVMVVHDTAHLAAACPRLLDLRRRRAHQFRVLQSASEHHTCMQPFLIGDGRDLVTRFHADHLRGKLCLDEPAEVAGFEQRFEQLVEKAAPAAGLDSLDL